MYVCIYMYVCVCVYEPIQIYILFITYSAVAIDGFGDSAFIIC